MADNKLTNNFSAPVPNNEHSLSAGERGPLLLQDYFLIEKLVHSIASAFRSVSSTRRALGPSVISRRARICRSTRARICSVKSAAKHRFSYASLRWAVRKARPMQIAIHALIPVNCPYAKRLNNFQRDGGMSVDGKGRATPNYSPNTRGRPVADPTATEAKIPLQGTSVRTEYNQVDRADDFEQAGLLYRVMTEPERGRLVESIAGHLGSARVEVQERQLQHFYTADPEYGALVATALGIRKAA